MSFMDIGVSELGCGCSFDFVWVSASLYECFDNHSLIQLSTFGTNGAKWYWY